MQPYQNVMLPKCVLPRCPITKMYVTKMPYYQNVMLPNFLSRRCLITKMDVTKMFNYQNVCYQNCLLTKRPITEMSSYRNILLPKCLLPKRPLPKCPLPKYLDTVCACICVCFSPCDVADTTVHHILHFTYLRNRVLIVCARVMLCTARISFLLSGAAKISHNAVSLSFRISQQVA